MKDDTQYKIKDLYGKFDEMKTSFNARLDKMEINQEKSMKSIESKLDVFIATQAKRESDQDEDIQDLKTKAAVADTKHGMIAGGLTAFSTVAALITYYLTSK